MLNRFFNCFFNVFVRKFKAMSKDVQSSLDPLVTVRLMKKLKTSSTWEVKKNSALFLSVTIIDVLLFFYGHV
jgi:hypothetical protein